jgi:DNA-binding response OmpR family regulator
MPYHIAIVEDDIDQQQNYVDSLTRKGFTTSCYANVEDALIGIQDNPPDMALLDVVLGDDEDGGFTICRRLLDGGSTLPIIFLTDRSDEIDQVFGLRLGAWDYQTKPISLALLAERIKSLQRIHQARINTPNKPASNSTQQHTNVLSIDAEKSYVSWHGETIPLTLTEFRILHAIYQSGSEGLDYQALAETTMQRLVTNGTINSHVKNIRKKFNATGKEFLHIHNKPGFGYRWEAP